MSDRTVWRLEAENERLRDEIASLRLTDAERAALESEVELAEYQQRHEAATLRGLLDRLGGKNE